MPLGDESRIEIMLDIQGRNDASGAAERAAADIAALDAANQKLAKSTDEARKADEARVAHLVTSREQYLRNEVMARNLAPEEMKRADAATREYQNARTEANRAFQDRMNAAQAAQRANDNLLNQEQKLEDVRKRMDDAQAKADQEYRYIPQTRSYLDPRTNRFVSPAQISEQNRVAAQAVNEYEQQQERIAKARAKADEAYSVLDSKSKVLGAANERMRYATQDLQIAQEKGINTVERTASAYDATRAKLAASESDTGDLVQSLDEVDKRMSLVGSHFYSAGLKLEDVGKAAKDTGKKVEDADAFWMHASNTLDKWGKSADRAGVGALRWGMLLGVPLRGLSALMKPAAATESAIEGVTSKMGFASGVISILGGGLITIAGLFAILPAVVGAAAAVVTVFGDAIGALVAVAAGLLAPLTLLGAFTLGPLAALAYTFKDVLGAQSEFTTAQRAYQQAQITYQRDLKSTSATPLQIQTAREQLQQSRRAFIQARDIQRIAGPLGLPKLETYAGDIGHAVEQRLLPTVVTMVGMARNFLGYFQKAVQLPLPQMFKSFSTTGVNMIFKDIERLAHIAAPLVRDAFYAAFTYSGDLHNKLVTMWNQITNFFGGQHGALVPARKWWDEQSFTREGIGLFHTFMGFLDRSGIFNQLGGSLGKILIDAGHTFISWFVATLKGEFGVLAQLFAAAMTAAFALSFSGVGVAGGIGALAKFVVSRATGGVGVAGAAELAGGAGGLGLAGFAGAAGLGALVAAPLVLPGLLLGRDRATGAQIMRSIASVRALMTSGSDTGPLQVQLRDAQQSLRALQGPAFARGRVMSSAMLLQGMRFTGPQIMSTEEAILNASGVAGGTPTARLAEAMSRVAGRALAPNEIALLRQQPMRVQPAIGAFAHITGMIPSRAVINVLLDHQRASQAIAVLMAETRKMIGPKDLHILTDIPKVALPAVERLIERIHHMPDKKQLAVTITGAEKAHKDIEEMQQRAERLHQMLQHPEQIHWNKSNAELATKVNDAQTKLQALKSKSQSLFTLPVYAAIGKAIPDGIAAGINQGAPVAIAAMTSLVSKLNTIARTQIKAHSPSQLFADTVGTPIVQGISKGMLAAEGGLKQAWQSILQNLESQFTTFQQQFQGLVGTLFTGPAGGGVSLQTGFQTRLATLIGFPGAKIPFSAVSGDLRAQVNAFRTFTRSLHRLRAEGYPETLVQQIAAIGPTAQREIDALLGANRGQRREYSKLFNEQTRLVNQAADYQTKLQLNQWESMGKQFAFAILTGMHQVEPQILRFLSRLARQEFTHHRRGHHLGHHHAAVHHTTVHQTVHAHHSESLGTALRRASFYYRNTA